MAWIEVAVDGNPPNLGTGSPTLYQITDGESVVLCGWLDDHWMFTNVNTLSVTHWQEWLPTDPPPTDGWTAIEDFVAPEGLITLVEVYDGSSTSLTAWLGNSIQNWLVEVPGTTHWKLPTLDAPPAP